MERNSDKYDVIVIGSGPAGYVAAIRCAQLGLKTACIDDWTGKDGKHSLGGTFFNSGCIPSLALLDSAKQYQAANGNLADHGINISGVELDLPQMIRHKDAIVKILSDQIADLFKTNQIECIHAHGYLLPDKTVQLEPASGSAPIRLLSADNIILAAGSKPLSIGAALLDGEGIVDSYAAMNFDTVPRHLGIIGAGVIGLEHASVWARLGSRVTLFDAQNDFLSLGDKQITDEALRIYSQQGLDIRFCARVIEAKKTPKHVSVRYEDNEGKHRLMLDKLIVAVGRKPNTENLFAPESELLLDEQGFVYVDEQCMTSLPCVYAIGDLIQGPMLAHKGSQEGILVAEIIGGKERSLNNAIIPNVIYTEPEIAWVGQTEQQLKATGEPIKVGVFPFSANACAQAIEQTDGMVKIIAQKETDKILGVHILGNCASELIGEAVLAMEFSASTEDLARTIHAHPSLSKAIHEAAIAVDQRALHVPRREI